MGITQNGGNGTRVLAEVADEQAQSWADERVFMKQAYGKDYRFSGQVSRALAIPTDLNPILEWCRIHIDASLDSGACKED
jgi:hypothetical protein